MAHVYLVILVFPRLWILEVEWELVSLITEMSYDVNGFVKHLSCFPICITGLV